jgi:hypothetical protein
MASDYQEITRHNERQLGLDTSSRKTQICMYSDSTHFVYEILQNADDYGATEVLFSLTQNELIIEHNGQPFNEENVRAITYFGKSTSRDDLVKAGRFGVGFKSVFAFTATPIIISGEEHFRTHGLYRVSEYPYPEGFSHSRTRIILPFNHRAEEPDYVEDLLAPEEAYSKISARLTDLNMNTLLFTRNVREIRWQIEGASGHYLREDQLRDGARLTRITDGSTLNTYLVFARVPTWRDKQYKAVEIAFALEDRGQLTAIQDNLYVLFATTQETHLQFVINGPYRTNPSRETISEDDAFNCHLLKETCGLLQQTLPRLRDDGLLTTQCLGILPNPTDNLRKFYAPLMNAVIDVFRCEELVPTDDDSHARATSVLQGPVALREVITRSELPFFAGSSASRWAKGVVQNTRPDHFLRGLNIIQWGWQELEKTLREKYASYYYAPEMSDIQWLSDWTDEWLQKLYILLGDAIKKGDCNSWPLQQCRIIRVTQNGEETHVAGSKAYFPKGKAYGNLPQIKRDILRAATSQRSKKIEEALTTLGVRPIGGEELIDVILETYYGEESPHIDKKQHTEHMRTFVKWWAEQKSVDKFTDRAIFRVSGADKLKRSSECYMDIPLRSSGLSQIYGTSRVGIKSRDKLWSRYKDLSSDGFCDFAASCGVADCVPIVKQRCWSHPNWSGMCQGLGWVRESNYCINEDFTIEELPNLLALCDLKVNALIWRAVCKAPPDVLEAKYRPNLRYNTRAQKSTLILQLSALAWIPDNKGALHQPAQISKDELHPDFKYDNRNGWLDEIGFGEEKKQADQEYQKRKEMAHSLGIRPGIFELLKTLPTAEQAEIQDQIEDMLKKHAAAHRRARMLQQGALPFHEALATVFRASGSHQELSEPSVPGVSRNPERRGEKLTDEISNAIQNEPSPEMRFTFGILKKWKSKDDLSRVKLVEWYGGRCQICKRTFTQRNGQPYFEALYLVPYTRADWMDRPGNILCLCPWHSAMFHFGTKDVDGNIVDRILSFVPKAMGGAGDATLEMMLCGERVTLCFAEDHFLELQVMARESVQVSKAQIRCDATT